MSNTLIRIKDLPASPSVGGTDNFVADGPNGTRRISEPDIIALIQAGAPDIVYIGWAFDLKNFQIVSSSQTLGVISSASVIWPDGSAGVYTATISPTYFQASTYTITHVNSARTFTQPPVTFDTSGTVTVRPMITIT